MSERSLLTKLRRFMLARAWLLVACLAAVAILAAARASSMASEGSQERSLAEVLRRQGLFVDVNSVVWLEPDDGVLSMRPAVFLAHSEGQLDDLYYVEFRPGARGAILDAAWVSNLTRTTGAAEFAPMRLGHHVLYASLVQGQYDAVTVLDVAGEPAGVTADWPALTRMQDAVTNLQLTGRLAGFGRRRYSLTPPADNLVVTVARHHFVIEADGYRVLIDPERATPIAGADRVEVRPQTKGMPGTISWVVDTVRKVSWIGAAPIEWLEHRVFGLKDMVERLWHSAGTDEAEVVEDAAEDLGITEEVRRERLEFSVTDPEIGWPPTRARTVFRRRLPGEGEWVAVVNDPFAAHYPGAPPAFYQTFLRSDAERAYTRVYITVWDPRQVQLHIMAGTREPESSTGETGPGMVPRDEASLLGLVAGFNGGFQALHGEFGMMAEGRVYLPPKPWAATVAVHADGRVTMGSWIGPPRGTRSYDELQAVAQIPDDVVAMRQNLTSVVEGRRYNPWGRWWWGAAPLNTTDQTYIDRSGLCLTQEGFLAYFWGRSMGSEALGRAMLAIRCVRGMHLDMNSSHTGFEFYNVRRDDAPFDPLDRELTSAEFEGPMPLAPGYILRARKMVTNMRPMRFPRYVARDPRDFFFLTLRPILPGPVARADGPVEFSAAGLPHAGWPYAFARASVGAEPGARTWFVRIDPRRAVPAPVATEGMTRPLAYLAEAAPLATDTDATHALFAERQLIGWRYGVGTAPEEARVLVTGPRLVDSPDADAAIGVDGDGFLVYGERQARDSVRLLGRMRQLGVADAVALKEPVRLAFPVEGRFVGPDAYERDVVTERALPLLANEGSASAVLFPDVRPRPYWYWARLQDSRVRYFRQGPPTFRMDGGGLRAVDAGVDH